MSARLNGYPAKHIGDTANHTGDAAGGNVAVTEHTGRQTAASDSIHHRQ